MAKTEHGPLWPYMIIAKDAPNNEGWLVWAWRGPECAHGTGQPSQAAALADLSSASGVPAHVREEAKRQYNEIAANAFHKATASFRAPGWDL